MEFLLDDEELESVVRVKRAMKKMVKEDGGGGGGPPGGDGGDGGGVDEDENEDRDEDEKPDDGDGARKDRDSSRKEGNDEKGKGRGTTGGNTLGLAPTLDNSKISTKPAEVSSLFPTAHRSSVLMSLPPPYRSLEIEMIRPHPQPLTLHLPRPSPSLDSKVLLPISIRLKHHSLPDPLAIPITRSRIG